MGIFNFLKKKNSSSNNELLAVGKQSTINSELDSDNTKVINNNSKLEFFNDNFAYIESLNISGCVKNSSNNKYSILVSDRQNYYVFFENNIFKLKGKLERPNDGKVANNGTFIINDWLTEGNLKGIFYTFDVNGKCIVKHTFNANLLNNALSDDGKFACVQSCNADSDDARKLYFFDLENKSLLWSKSMFSGWADSYTIDTDSKTLILHYKNESVEYDFDGNIKDLDKWKTQRLSVLDRYELKSIAEDLIKSNNSNIKIYENEILELLNVAELKEVSNYQLAQCYRWLGEAFFKLNDTNSTIKYFKKALELYPKIGVKKLYTKLISE